MSPMGSGTKTVRFYALSTCPVCKKVKLYLDGHAVSYAYVEVDRLEGGEQWLASQEVRKHNPAGSYPTVVIEEVITGHDEEGLKRALGLA